LAGIQHILRKAALEKMSSPEQLDMAMRVTKPWGWFALAGLGVLILAAAVMSVVARVPVKVDGTGILLRGDLGTVEANANGIIDTLLVKEGGEIKSGQTLATIKLPEVESEIQATRSRIEELNKEVDERGSQTGSLRASYDQQLTNLYRRRERVEGLVRKGYKTVNDLADIDAQISAVKSQKVQAGTGQTQITSQLKEQKVRLDQLLGRLKAESVIVSQHVGRVAAILKREGQLIQKGEKLLNLEDPNAPFQVLLFVPFAEGKKVVPNQVVRISPSTVRPEEHGFILGTIESVSSLPVTPEEVRTTLNNDQLARKFAEETPFRVIARPLIDSASGKFLWTSSGGTPPQVAANTPCTAQIIIDQRTPISYVIPEFKKAVGIGN